jgi:hypothetical protein
MVYQGTIQNGVVVFPNGVSLPEGSRVNVELLPKTSETPNTDKADARELDPVWRMAELAVDTGIPDLGVNINHYLYGHPKVKDVK